MVSSPISRRLVRGGLVLMDPNASVVRSVIAMRYNPSSQPVYFDAGDERPFGRTGGSRNAENDDGILG